MRSFSLNIISLIIISFFALNAVAKPQWRHRHNQGSPPAGQPTTTANSPATSVQPLSSSSTDSSTTSDKSSTTSDTSDTSSDTTSGAGSGTPGQALIVNKCSFPTYLVVCIQHPASCSDTHTLAATTGTYSESYGPASDGGHSLKISVEKGSADILQFEYTNEGNGDISYDLSEVNGNPFGEWGFTLTNTTTDAWCGPPATRCPAIFTQPTDGVPYTASTGEGTGAILCG